MNKIELKKFSLYFFILFTIFVIDRLTKLYILNLAQIEKSVDIYVNSYLNIYLIWNKGIAFGLLSIDESLFYNLITTLIGIIILIIFYMIWKNDNIQRFFLTLVAGGAMGNFYDRIVYKAVPDFIDVLCLILVELFNNNNKNDKL